MHSTVQYKVSSSHREEEQYAPGAAHRLTTRAGPSLVADTGPSATLMTSTP